MTNIYRIDCETFHVQPLDSGTVIYNNFYLLNFKLFAVHI
jgi:hypothetical protein